jgi:hypothetical protein
MEEPGRVRRLHEDKGEARHPGRVAWNRRVARTACGASVGRDVMRSLLFLLLAFLSMLANVTGQDIRYDPRNDAEMSWHLDTAGKHMEDDIQQLSK